MISVSKVLCTYFKYIANIISQNVLKINSYLYMGCENMTAKKGKHLGLRIDSETHDKLYYIAEYEGRSGNGQILHLIRRCIEDFEKEHGKIELKEPSE